MTLPTWHDAYEQRLDDLYGKLVAAFDAHPDHVIVPLSDLVPEDQAQMMVQKKERLGFPVEPQICKVNARCDNLNATIITLIHETWPEEDVAVALRKREIGPGLVSEATEMLRYDAEANRVFPHGAITPVDPRTTATKSVE